MDTQPGQPRWWRAVTTVLAFAAATGVLLLLAGARRPGTITLAGACVTWGVARIAALRYRGRP